MTRSFIPSLASCVALVLAACATGDSVSESASAGNLIVSHIFAPAPVAPDVMSLYFTIENTGENDDTLLAVRTVIADSASVHASVTEDGMTRMERVAHLRLPAGGIVELAPGGLHVMLSNLRGSVAEGDTVDVALVFASAPPIELRIPVVSYANLPGSE